MAQTAYKEICKENLTPEQKIDWVVKQAAALPAQTRVAILVSQLVDQRSSSASHVAKAISTDQVLTARVLRIANSQFYGSPRRISTLTDAIVLLGMRAIRDIALSASTHELLMQEVVAYSLKQGSLWLHSNCCGYAAQLLARHIHYPAPEEAYIAGLLHDIGKVAISQYLTEEAIVIQNIAKINGVSYFDAERETLGFDHAIIGAKMCHAWNLPEQLVEAIRYHHNPSECENPGTLSWIVHVADICCLMLGVGIGGDGLRYSFNETAIEALNLDQDTLEQVIAGTVEFSSITPQ